MSRVDFGIVGQRKHVDITIPGVNLAIYSSLELLLTREGFSLATIPITIDDGPNGKGHFEIPAATMTKGSHSYRIKAVEISTAEDHFWPDDKVPVCLIVSPAPA